MDWLALLLICGTSALICSGGSLVCASLKRYLLGLLFGILELAAAAVASYGWAWALRISGKTDWFLLGIFGYTPVSLVFWAMLAAGAVCLVINGRGLVRKWTSARA